MVGTVGVEHVECMGFGLKQLSCNAVCMRVHLMGHASRVIASYGASQSNESSACLIDDVMLNRTLSSSLQEQEMIAVSPQRSNYE